MVEISVNGKKRQVEPGTTINQLLESLELHPRTVALEYNREILKRDHYQDTVVVDGDRLEIVRFVQGG